MSVTVWKIQPYSEITAVHGYLSKSSKKEIIHSREMIFFPSRKISLICNLWTWLKFNDRQHHIKERVISEGSSRSLLLKVLVNIRYVAAKFMYIGWPEPNGKNKACCSPVMLASLLNSDLTVRVKGLKSLSLFQKWENLSLREVMPKVVRLLVTARGVPPTPFYSAVFTQTQNRTWK